MVQYVHCRGCSMDTLLALTSLNCWKAYAKVSTRCASLNRWAGITGPSSPCGLHQARVVLVLVDGSHTTISPRHHAPTTATTSVKYKVSSKYCIHYITHSTGSPAAACLLTLCSPYLHSRMLHIKETNHVEVPQPWGSQGRCLAVGEAAGSLPVQPLVRRSSQITSKVVVHQTLGPCTGQAYERQYRRTKPGPSPFHHNPVCSRALVMGMACWPEVPRKQMRMWCTAGAATH